MRAHARTARKRLKAIDLFSGCGGLSQGLKRAGFDVVGAVEIDALAAETYKQNHPRTRLWQRDIRSLTGPSILRELGLDPGELDLLAGCPPCQGFSSMRRLNGGKRVYDENNDLVMEFCRIVKGLKPKAVMMENVPGLARNKRFAKLKRTLKNMGYQISAEIKDAQHYGVPQRRRRLILLAGKGFGISFASPTRKLRTVRDAFRKLSGRRAKSDPLHLLPEKRTEKVRNLIRLIPRNGGSRQALGEARQLSCHKRCNGFNDVYGRMSWDSVAPTITGGCCNPSKGRFLHPSKARNISLREAALLQSFPTTYHFSLSRGKFPAAQMIGNALPPEFVRRHAAKVAAALRVA